MPRKIKVLDIIPENNENECENDEIKEVKEPEPIIESNESNEKQTEKTPKPVEENIKETPTEIKQEVIQETPTEIVQEEPKNLRIQELVKCPDCGKNMTKKTLKYFHPKVCPKATNKTEVKPKKEKIKVKEIEEIPEQIPDEPLTPKIPKKVDYTPPVELTYEDMRKQRLKERMEQRTIKIQQLFSNAI